MNSRHQLTPQTVDRRTYNSTLLANHHSGVPTRLDTARNLNATLASENNNAGKSINIPLTPVKICCLYIFLHF
jgi:hypothetical protein